MTGRSQRLLARDKAMADLAAAGKAAAEIADVLDVNPQLVRIWAKLAGVKLVRQTKKSDERADRMALMYRQGVTLAKIGNQYGLTRERVRQIIGKTGITAAEGGVSKSSFTACLPMVSRGVLKRGCGEQERMVEVLAGSARRRLHVG